MNEGFRSFANALIDYAGMFPPAELPLEPAIRNYARYRAEPEGWMLARFICAATRLEDLAAFAEEVFAADPPPRFAALARGGEDAATFLGNLRLDLEAVRQFHDRIGRMGLVEILEARFPPDLLGGGRAGDVPLFLERTADLAEELGPPGLRLYFEAPVGAGTEPAALASLIRALGTRGEGRMGFKLRCGGTAPGAVPTSERIAFVLASCRAAATPFKATAGLHHPLRHPDREAGDPAHGFLNLVGAALLVHEHNLDAKGIRMILEDTDPRSFRFSDAGFAWNDRAISTARIDALRASLVTSFGSCSFDEPRADLRVLGLLEGT